MPGRKDNTDYSRLREYFATHPISAVPYIAPSDNTRVTNVTQRINADRQVRQAQQGFAQRKQQIQAAKRQAYRQRKAAESPLQIPMSDEAIDAAIAAEERVANGPKFEQGNARPNIDTDRLANQYANMQSFYAALGSPNIMPMTSAQVRRNPEIAATQMQFGLDNPALTMLQVAAPTGPSTGIASAAGSAFRTGMSTAKPMVTRLITSTGRAATAGGRQIIQNAPRVAASTTVNAIPTMAVAAPVADSNSPGNPWWQAPATVVGLAVGGYGAYRGLKWGKGKLFGSKAAKEVAQSTPYIYAPNKKLFAWERPESWEYRARRQAHRDFKANMAQEWNNAVTSGTTQAFKDKYGLSYKQGKKKIYFDDAEVADRIQYGSFTDGVTTDGIPISFQNLPNWNNRVYTGPTTSQVGWAYARNAGRIGTWLGTPVFGLSLYNNLSSSENSNTNRGDEPKKGQSQSTQPKKEEQAARSDTTVAIPWGQPAPVTTSNQQQLDSINKQWREQLNN